MLAAGLAPNANWATRGRRAAGRAPMGAAALVVILILALLASAAPVFSPYDPLAQDYNALLKGPTLAHPLGTDQIGRDLLSRIIYGTRISFAVGVVAVGLALAIGAPLGLLAGYSRGFVDELVMRVMDAIIAFPGVILALPSSPCWNRTC